MDENQKLKELYANRSKHSNYQILSKRLSEILPPEQTEVRSRFENERLEYILSHVDVKDKTFMDVGGNTGFFSFELIDKGAKHIYYVEGNKEHADFVSIAADALGENDKLEVSNTYLEFGNDFNSKYDVIILLNVLHHIGDDYGNSQLTIENAKKEIIKQLSNLQKNAEHIVFQLGFNWKGNRNLGLFKNGTKQELIDFISLGIKELFEIESIGVAVKKGGQIIYEEINNENIERDDSLGEFLNRPLFILKSK